MSSTAIVLAAGLGVRMKSNKPKVLHAAAGRPLIDHVVNNLKQAGISSIRIVVGHGSLEVQDHLKDVGGVSFFNQKQQRGTADAVKSAGISSLEGMTLICNGDHPLIRGDDYHAALNAFEKSKCDLMVVTSQVRNPKSFGRIIRSDRGAFLSIVEEKDATDLQRKIREVNSGL